MECLRFCLFHEFGGKGADSTVQEYLIKEQVGQLLNFSLSILLFSHVFSLHLHDQGQGKAIFNGFKIVELLCFLLFMYSIFLFVIETKNKESSAA